MDCLIRLLDAAICYGFIGLGELKKFGKKQIEYINYEFLVDNLQVKYSFGDDYDLLTVNCYDIEKKKDIFNWSFLDLPRKFWSREQITALYKIEKHIEACIKEQDPSFLRKLAAKEKIFSNALNFYRNPTQRNNPWDQISQLLYESLWGIGVVWNKKLYSRIPDYCW